MFETVPSARLSDELAIVAGGIAEAFDLAIVGLALLSPDGRFEHVNRSFCEILGRAATEIIGNRYSDLSPEHGQLISVTVDPDDADGGSEKRPVEKRFTRPDGTVVWGLVTAAELLDDAGDRRGFLVQIQPNAHHDQEERLAAILDRLSEAEQRYRLMLERLPVVSYRVELNGSGPGARYVTPGIEQLTGISAAEWMSDPGIWPKVIHPDDEREVLEAWAPLVSGGQQRFSMEYRIVRVDGSVVWVRDQAWTVATGGSSHFEGIFLDITAQREAEEALIRQAELVAEANARLLDLDSTRTSFFTTASHELRTPVTSVIGYVTTLSQRWDEIDETHRREFVAGIDRHAHRLLRLLEELLTIARMDAEGVKTRLLPVEVAPAVGRSVAWFDAEHLEILDEVPAGLRILTDPERFHQILTNLIANARKYGAQPITVDAYADHASVVVRVIDRGPGVPEDLLGTLFQRFGRSEQQESRVQQGFGLGLAISRELARALGGDLWYEAAPPHGASFSLRLPEASAFPADDA